MQTTKDMKPIFNWAEQNGETKIIDRILVKTLPHFLKSNHTLSIAAIQTSKVLEVHTDLYNLVKSTAEELVGSSYQD